MRVDPDCVFCKIVAGDAPAKVVERSPRHLIFEPLAPHAPGHVLVIPTDHLRDAVEAPIRTGHVIERAARYAQRFEAAQILTSIGEAATQSVFHLHWHVIPRGPEDGLHHDWPWCRDDLDFDRHMGLPT